MSPLDSTLRAINRQTEEEGAQQLATTLGLSYALLDDFPFNIDVLSLVPIETATSGQYAVYIRSAKKVRVALVNPADERVGTAIANLERTMGVEVERTIVSRTSFTHLLTTYANLKQQQADAKQQAAEAALHSAEEQAAAQLHTLSELNATPEGVSTTEELETILRAAYTDGASDIHIEPGETQLTVRFRIDGVLQSVLHLPMAQHKPILSRVKMLSHLKLDEHQHNQDGRFSLQEQGIPLDVRVALTPTGYGEGVVMRLLRHDSQLLSLEQLGFNAEIEAVIEKAIRRPYGLIIVTGPTGSGKSSTLYAILQRLNNPERKIISLEDPIEYRIEGIQQTQIDPENGFGFAEGLKGALRQDPDVVMVGEIRDPETATIALNASLTGHLVLTTMHTNDAVSAYARLLELGVAPFLLSGSINLVVGQRLVRRLVAGSTAEAPQYKGRIVIAEALIPSPGLEQALQKSTNLASLEDLARTEGFVPMLEDGLAKVKAGITTETEIYRVTTV